MKAIILAAGYTNRLYPLIKDRPKPLLTIRKKPVIEYIIAKLESLEQIARITLILQQLGRGQPLPPEQVEKLLAQRQKMGLAHPGEQEEFCQVCGVCHIDGHHLQPIPSAEPETDLVRLITQAVLRELGRAG